MEETEEMTFKQTSVLSFKCYTQYSTLNIFFILFFTTFIPYIFAYLNCIFNLFRKRKKQLQFTYTFIFQTSYLNNTQPSYAIR